MTFQLRPIEYPADPYTPEVAELVLNDIYQGAFGGDPIETHLSIVKGFDNLVLETKTGGLVGVGSLDLSSAELKMAVMRNIAVVTEFRKQGAGRELITGLESRAQANGAEIARVSATTKSAGFYEHLGYRSIGDDPLELAKIL